MILSNHKTLHRKLKTEQHEPDKKPGMNSDTRVGVRSSCCTFLLFKYRCMQRENSRSLGILVRMNMDVNEYMRDYPTLHLDTN